MATNTKKLTKKVIQLVDGLKECWPDFDIKVTDFLNPTLATVIKFYERFLHNFGIVTETVIQILNQKCDPYDKELEDIMYVYVLYSCANRVYHLLNLRTLANFALPSLSSFINPVDVDELVNRILLLANYLYYAEGRIRDILIPLKDKVLEEVTSLETMNEKVKMLNEHLKSASLTQSKNMDKLQNLRKNTNILKADIKERQKSSTDLEQEIQRLNVELKSLEDENDRLTQSVETNMLKGKELKSLIVEDNESIESQIEVVNQEIEEIQTQVPEYMTNLESKIKTESILAKNYEAICALNKSSYLPKILERFNLIEENKLQKEFLHKELIVLQKVENEELKKKNDLELEFNKTEKNYNSLNAEVKTRSKSSDQEITKLETEYEVAKKELENTKVLAAELNDKLKHFDNCCNEYKKIIDNQNKFYEKLYKSYTDAKDKLEVSVKSVLTNIKSL